MQKIHFKSLFLVSALLVNSIYLPVIAQDNEPLLDRNLFSIGFGISDNSAGKSDKIGYQFFVAYDLNQINLMNGVSSSVEFGIMDYGFSGDSTGIWGTYVVDGQISEQFHWLGRAGYDIGDDNGLMFGAGVGYQMNSRSQLRLEYVIRDDIDSLQFNFLYHL